MKVRLPEIRWKQIRQKKIQPKKIQFRKIQLKNIQPKKIQIKKKLLKKSQRENQKQTSVKTFFTGMWEKGKEKMDIRRFSFRQKVCAMLAMMLVLTATAGGIGWHLCVLAGEPEQMARETTLSHGNLDVIFTGEGTTAEGTINQRPDFDVSVTDFTVKEVCVAAGDTVKKGDTLYVLEEADIEKAKTYYEEAIEDAEKDYEKAQTAYETGKLQASYDKKESETTAASAQSVYDAANSTLEQNVEDAQSALTNAQNQISVYQSNLDANQYYTDAGIDTKKEALQQAQAAEDSAKQAWQSAKQAYEEQETALNSLLDALSKASVSEETEDLNNLNSQIAAITETKQNLADKKAALTETENTYQAAVEAQKKAKDDYDTACTSYEKAQSDASARKETLENSLPSLQLAYTSAVNAQKTGSVSNKSTYDTAVQQGESASDAYTVQVETLQQACDEAKKTVDTLKEQQAALQTIQDGAITAAYDGTIAAVTYKEEMKLDAQSALVSYSDTGMMTVAVEVSQENIASVSVGDTVSVSVMGGPGREALEGTVSEVASEATSGRSMSNVTYTVTIQLDNEDGTIPADTSAYVTFTSETLEDVDYIETDALQNSNGDQAEVLVKQESGETQSVSVTTGKTVGRYTVITGGITENDTCIIRMGGRNDDQTDQ